MDPYCIIKVREQEFRTTKKQEAGKEPKWNECFSIDVKYIGDDLSIHVMDDDVGKDDEVGRTRIKISSLCVNKGFDEWYEIYSKGDCAGRLHLRGEWLPNSKNLDCQMSTIDGQ